MRDAELDVKFARMELAQYLGEKLAGEVSDETDFARLSESPGPIRGPTEGSGRVDAEQGVAGSHAGQLVLLGLDHQ